MGFDYNSVLMASGAAGIAFCSTLVMSWMRERSSMFLLTWALAKTLVILAIVMFLVFQSTVETSHVVLAGVLLTTAFAFNYAGLKQFATGHLPVAAPAAIAIMSAIPIVAAGLMGLDGLVFVLINAISALILAFNAYQFWLIRAESPVPIGGIAFLHALIAVSFVLCAIVTGWETPLYLYGEPPSNWAEVLNLAISVVAITGIGGLFITIHQERISRHHRHASLTDPLTGLHNRRALFERFADGAVPEGTGLVVFDLDDFKGINDRYGHGFGDAVLRAFGHMLTASTREGDMAIRLGGEEFVVLLPESSATHALSFAERIRTKTSRMGHKHGDSAVHCTVSAGVAVASSADVSLDTLIRKADNALYLSKRNGRNRVSPTASSAA